MRTKKVIRNTVFVIIEYIIVFVIGLFLPRLYIKTYGDDINGVIGSISSYLSYFALIEAGIGGGIVYALFKPLNEKNAEKINVIMATANKKYFIMGLIFSTLVLIFASVFPFIIGAKELYLSIFSLVIVLSLPTIFDFFIFYKYSNFLRATENLHILSISKIIEKVLSLPALLILINYKVDIIIVKLVLATISFFRAFLVAFFTHRKYKSLKFKNVKADNHTIKNPMDTFFSTMVPKLITTTPVLIATLLIRFNSTITLSDISVLTVYNIIVVGIASVLSVFSSPLTPAIGRLIAGEDRNLVKKVFDEYQFFYYLITTIAFICTIILLPSFIKIYTSGITDVNYNRPLLGILLSFAFLLDTMRTPLDTLVHSSGLYRETRQTNIIQAIIIGITSTILGIFFGVEGVIAGVIIAALYRLIKLNALVPPLVFKENNSNLTLKLIISSILMVLIIGLPTYALKISINSILQWVLFALVIGICSLIIVVFAFFLIDKNTFKNVWVRFIGIFSKKKNTL